MSAELTVRPATSSSPHPPVLVAPLLTPSPASPAHSPAPAVPAPRRAGPRGTWPAGPQLLHGAAAVRGALAEVDELARCTGLPATARAAWVAVSLAQAPPAAAWAVLVRDADGRLTAAAVLLDDDAGRTTLAGTAGGYRGGLAAREPGSAH
ncbi:hypothetical protein GTR02_20370, partial [Kineococcus sp. R8]